MKAKITDLDTDLIKNVFDGKPHKMTEAKLLTLKILCGHNGKVHPTNGGMILFGKNDERLGHFPNTEISCARFDGISKANFIDRLDLTDSSLLSIEEVPKFIRRNTTMAAEFGEIKRKDIPQYPVKAIREVLLNALMHANYELKGSRFYVAIYDDRLEIQNPGSFPPGMTIDDFKAGISKIRNPTIARIFREKENLEAWGSGYERICNICEKEGYPLPEWEEVGPVMRATFYPKELSAKLSASKASSRHQVDTKLELSEEEHKIMAFCESPKAIKEILDQLQYTDRSKFRDKYINPMINEGLLEMTDPGSPKSPKQKYKMTAFGKELLTKTETS